MRKDKTNILLSVKNKSDSTLLHEFLIAEGYGVEHLRQREDMALADKKFDALLADTTLGSRMIIEIQKIKKSSNLFLPVLVLLPAKEQAMKW